MVVSGIIATFIGGLLLQRASTSSTRTPGQDDAVAPEASSSVEPAVQPQVPERPAVQPERSTSEEPEDGLSPESKRILGALRQRIIAPEPRLHTTSRCAEILSGHTCGTSDYSCISLRTAPASECQGDCATELAQSLRKMGIAVLEGGPAWPDIKGCVGYREDIGGTLEGAQCLQALLGSRYQLHDPAQNRSCVADGYPYTVGTF
jgi:hypothetical protein